MYEKLRETRKREGIRVRAIADALGLKTVPAYFKKETGMVKITVEEALILAQLFNTTVEELFPRISV